MDFRRVELLESPLGNLNKNLENRDVATSRVRLLFFRTYPCKSDYTCFIQNPILGRAPPGDGNGGRNRPPPPAQSYHARASNIPFGLPLTPTKSGGASSGNALKPKD